MKSPLHKSHKDLDVVFISLLVLSVIFIIIIKKLNNYKQKFRSLLE